MRYFVLPFALSIPMAVPLLWYHLDGLDPADIDQREPSQEEIDFAATREHLRGLGANPYEHRKGQVAAPADYVLTVDSTSPGY